MLPQELLPWLPAGWRFLVYLLVTLGWMLLFAYGTFRMLFAREWGYACFCSLFVIIPVFLVWRTWSQLARDAQGPTDSQEVPPGASS